MALLSLHHAADISLSSKELALHACTKDSNNKNEPQAITGTQRERDHAMKRQWLAFQIFTGLHS